MQIRYKAKWIEEGERNKYFLTLEKIHGQQKIMTEVEMENNKIVTNQEAIMKYQVQFYKNLYKQDNEVNADQLDNFITYVHIPTLDEYNKTKYKKNISIHD